MLDKIISGGQTGAERAALDAAIDLEIPYSGCVPKGRKTDDGILPDQYKLTETPGKSNSNYTERNVIDSDGILIFSHGKLRGGSVWPIKLANRHKRQYLHIDLDQTPAFNAATVILDWIMKNSIRNLNITGPRASKDPSIYEHTKKIISSLYYLSFVRDAMPELSSIKNEYPTITTEPEMPNTVDEAVEQIINAMPLRDKVTLSNFTYDELAGLQATLGVYIRKKLEVWSGKSSPAELLS